MDHLVDIEWYIVSRIRNLIGCSIIVMGKLAKALSVFRNEGTIPLLRTVVRRSKYELVSRLKITEREFFPHLVEWLKRPLNQDTSRDPYHLNFQAFINQANDSDRPEILEIGSRNVMGNLRKHMFLNYGEYVGFDIHLGENVDVVGDVHQLSKYFVKERFDFVYSISVFEHLAMPWKAILEINKVMKEGGLLFIATHPTWPPHELPWDFWRYNEGAFKVLLNSLTGFEIVACSEGLPCSIVPLANEASMVGMWRCSAYLGISVVARKTGPPDKRLSWDIGLEEILDSIYPRNH